LQSTQNNAGPTEIIKTSASSSVTRLLYSPQLPTAVRFSKFQHMLSLTCTERMPLSLWAHCRAPIEPLSLSHAPCMWQKILLASCPIGLVTTKQWPLSTRAVIPATCCCCCKSSNAAVVSDNTVFAPASGRHACIKLTIRQQVTKHLEKSKHLQHLTALLVGHSLAYWDELKACPWNQMPAVLRTSNCKLLSL
jgi:hypothetical protein